MKHQRNSINSIQKRARSLPIGKCYINQDWKFTKLANVIVTRKYKDGNLIAGFFLVDLYCLGVRDTYYKSDLEEESLNNWIEESAELKSKFTEIDYALAHNIIYGAYEYGLENGIPQHKDFDKVTKYILEEDDEHIPLIELDLGRNGKPFYFQTEAQSDAFAENIIRLLKKNVGEGNFNYLLAKDIDDEEDWDEEDDWVDVDDEEDWDEDDEDEDDEDDEDDDGWYPDMADLPMFEFFREDGTIDINKANNSFDQSLKEGTAFVHYHKFVSASIAIIQYYADEQRTNMLFDKWEADLTVDPEFEIEAGLSEQQVDKIYDILTGDTPSLKDIRYIRNNIKNEALADYILLKAYMPKVDPENENISTVDYSEYNEREEQFVNDHPDYPLSKGMVESKKSLPEDFTLDLVFGSDYNFSIFEFNEYLMMKLDTIKENPDASAFLAFRAILGQYLDFHTVHEEIFLRNELLSIRYIHDNLLGK